MMAERDLILSGEHLPKELDAERQRLAYLYERTQADLVSRPENEEALLEELDELRRQYDEVKRQIRESSPELASLRYPSALDLAAIQDQLDPGTLLLAYAVMEEESILFAVGKQTGVKAFPISKGQSYFREQVESWAQQVTDPRMGKIGQSIFEKSGFELFQLLIQPVRAEMEQAQRLLIVPDGPLWRLPFGALPTSREGEARRYLIEEKPISTVVSASLYAELKQRPKRPITRIVAMGDAVYPAEKDAARSGSRQPLKTASSTKEASSPTQSLEAEVEPRVRALLERSAAGSLPRIPQTAAEVRSIAGLYGDAVRTYLREEANEDNFKRIGGDVDIVHVAAHGLVDDVRPLDSALLLTINDDFQEGEESGVVFAWEVFESLRLEADLVVLSACETGLGRESGGEGLIGLTRAFQFAGARSIIASYWNVEDGTTAVFMEKFYRHLKAGMDKAEALRQAQIAFIREPVKLPRSGWLSFLPDRAFDAAHPFYWAAFQLIGPWD